MLLIPCRTTCAPSHGAPPGASQGPALAVRASRAVQPIHTPSGMRRVLDKHSTDHAAQGKAGEDYPGVHKGVERGCRLVPPQQQLALWWQSTMPLERSASLLLAGHAHG